MSEDNKKLTLADVQKQLPSKKQSITQEIVDIFNASMDEAEFQGESLMETAITYEAVMTKNKVGIKDYLRALKFCAYLISTKDNLTEAYKKAFSDRKFVQDRLDVDKGSNQYKELTSAASRYRRSKVVVDILTVSQVPFELMFGGARYKAVGVLADVMMNGKYDRDRINAAKELLAATKSDTIKVDLGIEVKESSAVQNLNQQLAELAASQQHFLTTGATDLKELGSMKVKEEVIDADIE